MLNIGYLTADKTTKGDEVFTPFYAVKPLVKHLKASGYKTVWCLFDEDWSAYVRTFKEEGFKVIYSSLAGGKDFFNYEPDEPYDVIISNPPFSKKDAILKRLDKLGKPFAILLPMNSLQGRTRFNVFKNGIQLLSFDQRIGFHTEESLKTPVEGSPFASAYFCRGFLPKDLIIEELDKFNRSLIDEAGGK